MNNSGMNNGGMSPRLDRLVKETPAHYRGLGWLVAALLIGLAVWANYAELEEVAIAYGEVAPQGRVKVIQHLEGGIIQEIFVTEGDIVAVGEPLIQLDLTASSASREEMSLRLDSLILVRARLDAAARGEKPDFPEDVAVRRPTLLANEISVFEARQAQLDGTLKVLRDQAQQRELAVAEIRTEYASVTHSLTLSREIFAMSSDLLTDGLTPKIEHLKLQRDVEDLEGDLAMIEAAIPRAEAAQAEAQARIEEERLKFRSAALGLLGKTELSIAQTREALARATDTLARTEILSPIDGVVKSLRYNTIGGVVAPGDAIMEIVPTGDKLVIEAKLNPTDVGYVRIGQPAVIKINTYDFVRFGGLDGKIINLSADSYTDQNGAIYFRVVALTEKNYLGDQPGDFSISPGMEAQIDIHTGTKSVLSYLLKPVLKLKGEAFRER
jgi:adhesin transport system membrane fusion protein